MAVCRCSHGLREHRARCSSALRLLEAAAHRLKALALRGASDRLVRGSRARLFRFGGGQSAEIMPCCADVQFLRGAGEACLELQKLTHSKNPLNPAVHAGVDDAGVVASGSIVGQHLRACVIDGRQEAREELVLIPCCSPWQTARTAASR